MSNLSPYLPFKKPRRREFVGKQKRQYQDMNSPMKERKIDQSEKDQFLKEFKLKKAKEKRQRIILILTLVAVGIIALSLLFLLSPS